MSGNLSSGRNKQVHTTHHTYEGQSFSALAGLVKPKAVDDGDTIMSQTLTRKRT